MAKLLISLPWLGLLFFAVQPGCSNYIGCFTDSSLDRDLPAENTFENDNTVARCIDRCKGKGFKYAGLQYEKQCFCGNDYGKLDGKMARPDSECNLTCTGNRGQSCGGHWRNSVWNVEEATSRSEYIGCFSDYWDRDLPDQTTFDNDNSVTKCINHCKAWGFKYAGVQFEKECFCGNSYGKHDGKVARPDAECSLKCIGDRSQTCGGHWRSSVWRVPDDYKLKWSDEFDGDGIDRSKWDVEVNCWGGGNGEKQCYVDQRDTLLVEDGFLHMRAVNVPGWFHLSDSERNQCTLDNENSCSWWQPVKSGRIRTANSASGSWRYGRFAVRAKLPRGNFLWPAIWMLPTDYMYGGWASSGEIDIMEARGQDPHGIGHALHYGGSWPFNTYVHQAVEQQNIIDDFRVYGVDWERDYMRFFVDDVVTWELDLRRNWWSGRGPNPYTDIRQPFDQRFHFILNVAVGGSYFASSPTPFNENTDPDTWSRPEMTVDWVRVYQKT